jgi:hypothetical protein
LVEPEKFQVMTTTYDILMAKGKAEGIEIGKAEGEAKGKSEAIGSLIEVMPHLNDAELARIFKCTLEFVAQARASIGRMS